MVEEINISIRVFKLIASAVIDERDVEILLAPKV
jgi:hypothetical protein